MQVRLTRSGHQAAVAARAGSPASQRPVQRGHASNTGRSRRLIATRDLRVESGPDTPPDHPARSVLIGVALLMGPVAAVVVQPAFVFGGTYGYYRPYYGHHYYR